MRNPFIAALLLAGGLVLAASPALAQTGHGHGHGHGHSHDHDDDDAHEHSHDHGHQTRRHHQHRTAVRKAPPPVVAHPHGPAHDHGHAHGVETEDLFAFVDGSDIGEAGETHLSFSFEGRLGKRDGTFRALTPKLELGYNFTDRLHVALEVWSDHFKVQDNSDFEDENRWGGGVALEFKTVLVKRGPESPVGLAFLIAPHYSNSEDISGEPAIHYALEMKLIWDVELVEDKVFAAFNLLYEPEKVRPHGEEWEKESLFGVSAGLMTRISPAVFIGGEIQYFRKYEGYFFNELEGHALYIGPALHFDLGEHASASFGWQFQVAGKAVDEPGSRDLVNFEKQRFKAKFSRHF